MKDITLKALASLAKLLVIGYAAITAIFMPIAFEQRPGESSNPDPPEEIVTADITLGIGNTLYVPEPEVDFKKETARNTGHELHEILIAPVRSDNAEDPMSLASYNIGNDEGNIPDSDTASETYPYSDEETDKVPDDETPYQDESTWRNEVVAKALECVGNVEYKWGGDSLEEGCDCSGFVYAVYKACGLDDRFRGRCSCQKMVERAEKGKYEEVEPYEGAKPGDIIVFQNSEQYREENPDEDEYGHCGIYIGNGEIVQMQSQEKGCTRTKVQYRINHSEYKIIRIPEKTKKDTGLTPA